MRRELWANQTAARLWHEHGRGVLKAWDHPWHLEVWLRDEGCCVYCGRNMLQDRDITYFFYHYDHSECRRPREASSEQDTGLTAGAGVQLSLPSCSTLYNFSGVLAIPGTTDVIRRLHSEPAAKKA
jgi:hypothetical protein